MWDIVEKTLKTIASEKQRIGLNQSITSNIDHEINYQFTSLFKLVCNFVSHFKCYKHMKRSFDHII